MFYSELGYTNAAAVADTPQLRKGKQKKLSKSRNGSIRIAVATAAHCRLLSQQENGRNQTKEKGENRLLYNVCVCVCVTYVRVRNVDAESENATTVVELKDVGVTFGVDVVPCKTE